MAGRVIRDSMLMSVAATVVSAAYWQGDSLAVLDTMTVIGTRAALPLSGSSRNITVIGRQQLEALGGRALQEIIEGASVVDVRERGTEGVQADLSIRGSSFEQVLVMVDGIPLTDPQTGHHLMDLPVGVEHVERVEILSGQASRLYGPNAIGGVVNIVTRRPEATGVRVSTTAGQRGHMGARAEAEFAAGAGALLVAGSRTVSDGHWYNSDTDVRTVTVRSTGKVGNVRMDAFFGHVEKDFGANGFYSDRFPNQREHTTCMITAVRGHAEWGGSFNLSPYLLWRRHTDDFVLNFENPAFYQNITLTNVAGGGVQASLKWKLGTLSAAADGYWDHIRSDDLDRHQRLRTAIHLEHVFDFRDRIMLTPGLTAYFVKPHGWKAWPGGDISFRVLPWLRVYGGADYSFRVPTFTELYTGSPANAGDSTLKPERTLSYEAGLRFSPGFLRGTLGMYRRDGHDVIDWVRAPGQRQWVVGNVDRVDAWGVETHWQAHLLGRLTNRPAVVEAGYAFVTVERDPGALWQRYEARLPDTIVLSPALPLQYKYGTDYLRHKLVLGIDHTVFKAARANWRLRYELRNGTEKGTVLADGRIYLRTGKFGAYIEATNIFDTEYRDFASVPGVPRTFKAGADVGITVPNKIGRIRVRESDKTSEQQEAPSGVQ